jgi:hypothetical protein
MYISITGLKPKGAISFLLVWRYAIPSFRQAKTAKGNLFCEVKKINGLKSLSRAPIPSDYIFFNSSNFSSIV